MTTNYLKLFDSVERDKAQQNMDYYDGRSAPYVQSYINTRRTEAVSSGMTPFTRNLYKPIVDASGMLFNGKAPTILVYDKGTASGTGRVVNEAATLAAQKAFEDAGWIEYFNNFDAIVRFNKSAITQVEIDTDEDTGDRKFLFNALSQANAAAHFKPNGKMDTLIYFQGRNANNEEVYNLITPNSIADLVTSGLESGPGFNPAEEIRNPVPNPFAIVTAAQFHDTNIPFRGFWNPVPVDLSQMNLQYNIAMTDTNFSIQWSKFQTLFTNAVPDEAGLVDGSVYDEQKSKFAARNPQGASVNGPALRAGPGRVVGLDAGNESVYLEYKGPTPDLKMLDDVIDGWYRTFALDWSVNINNDETGFGGASSGFALAIREIPNVQLRKKRARMMEQGFKRLYEVMLRMSEVANMGLVQNTELFIEFSAPDLPLDEKANELVWSTKIKENRATVIEYFMVEQGLTREEAISKYKTQAEDRKIQAETDGITVDALIAREDVIKAGPSNTPAAPASAVVTAVV